MNGEYQPGEKQQEIEVIVRCKVKHSPGDVPHLQQLCLSYFQPKGVPVRLENNQIIIEI